MESDCATYLWIVGAALSGPRRPRPPLNRPPTLAPQNVRIRSLSHSALCRIPDLEGRFAPHHTTKPDPANLETVNDHAEQQAQIVAFRKGYEQFSRHHFCLPQSNLPPI